MHPEGALAERGVDDPDDRVGDGRHVGIGWHDGSKGLLDLLGEAGIGAGLVVGEACAIGPRAGMAK
jgi:hypothetical protein